MYIFVWSYVIILVFVLSVCLSYGQGQWISWKILNFPIPSISNIFVIRYKTTLRRNHYYMPCMFIDISIDRPSRPFNIFDPWPWRPYYLCLRIQRNPFTWSAISSFYDITLEREIPPTRTQEVEYIEYGYLKHSTIIPIMYNNVQAVDIWDLVMFVKCTLLL